ncbi:MAG: sigma-54 dependent transcriptional regulator [Myxococcota bacterium]|nr:sigma-54 dependent transcriptional regulator [Myxococcota bacterium]
MAAIFSCRGFEVSMAHDGPRGLAAVADVDPDVVLLDLEMPGMSGEQVLRTLRLTRPEIPVVMLTARHELKTAIHAIQLGAFDYQTKPVDHDDIVHTVDRAAEKHALEAELAQLRRQTGAGGLGTLMGTSTAVARICEQVATVATTTFTVLIVGETGTGKELVAQAIHSESDRRMQPFVALDCGAIPESLMESELFGHEKGAFTGAHDRKRGKFDVAAGGTVFLDEIGNLPLALQAKLLRVIEAREIHSVGGAEARPIDVRFIAATNDDLQQRASAGLFRMDLYFRLAAYTVTLPPLRDRLADLCALAERFVAEAAIELRRPIERIAPDAISALERYPWPGNVRELRNVMRQAVLESRTQVLDTATVERLLGKVADQAVAARTSDGRSLKQVADEAAHTAERQLICEMLRETSGNKTQAAHLLRTDFKTLHLKMRALGISARDFTRA